MKKTIKFIKYFIASSLVFITSWILGQRNSSDYSFTSIVHAEIPIYSGGGGGGWSGDSSGDSGTSDSGGTSVDGSGGSSDGGSCGTSSA